MNSSVSSSEMARLTGLWPRLAGADFTFAHAGERLAQCGAACAIASRSGADNVPGGRLWSRARPKYP